MKNKLLNLGTLLNRAEQKQVNGGWDEQCNSQNPCGSGRCCTAVGYCKSIYVHTAPFCVPLDI